MQTAFNFFAAEQWSVVKAELGANAAPQEISRAVGDKWNKATEEERQPYINKAQEDKNRFEHEMQGWKAGFESPAAAAATAAEGDAQVPADTAAAAAPAAGVSGTPGKPPIGKGLFTAAVPGDAMDVDAAAGDAGANQQHHKHKLKFKLMGAAGSMKPADGQPAVEAAAGVDAAAVDAAAAVAPVGVPEEAVKQEFAHAVPVVPAAAAEAEPSAVAVAEAPQAAAQEQPAAAVADQQ